MTLKEYRKRELNQIAMDIVDGKVFHTGMIQRKEDITSVFMPLIFMTKSQIKKIKKDKIVAFYEYTEKAMPRCLNGMPMFMSMNMLDKEEANYIDEKVEKYQEVKEEMLKK